MTKMTRPVATLHRIAAWMKATLHPHAVDPYEREPIYHAALATPHRKELHSGDVATTRQPRTARNHVLYPLD